MRQDEQTFKYEWKSSRGGIIWEALVETDQHSITARVEKRLMGWLLSAMIDNEIPDDIAGDERLNELHAHWDDAKHVGDEVINELVEWAKEEEKKAAAATATPTAPAAKLGIYYDLKVDAEIEKLIPPLSDEELDGLEASLLEDGCRDALIAWKETGILLDGHNRFRICEQHELDYDITEKSFEDRDAALCWVMRNQLSRRNLSESQRAMLVAELVKHPGGMRRPDQPRQTGGKFGSVDDSAASCKFATCGGLTENGKKALKTQVSQGQDKASSHRGLSDAAGVSPRTLGHARKVTAKGVQELKDAVMQGTVAVSAAAAVAELPEDEQREIVQAGPKAVKQAASQARVKPSTQQTPQPPEAPPTSGQDGGADGLVRPYVGRPFLDGDDLDEDELGLPNRVCDVLEDCERVAKDAHNLLNQHESSDHLIILTGMMAAAEAWGRLENDMAQANVNRSIVRFLESWGNPGAAEQFMKPED